LTQISKIEKFGLRGIVTEGLKYLLSYKLLDSVTTKNLALLVSLKLLKLKIILWRRKNKNYNFDEIPLSAGFLLVYFTAKKSCCFSLCIMQLK